MSQDSDKRNNAQTTILALLLIRKEGCTLSELCRDYYEQEGEPIPWKELGYVSVLHFLHSMPRVVQILNTKNKIFLRGIASDKTKHVSKLVAGQKEQRSCPNGRRSFKPSHYYPKTAPQKVYIPAEVLTEIVRLVENHPDGVNKDYIFSEVRKLMPFVIISMKEMEEQLQELSHKIFMSNNKVFPIQRKIKFHSSLKNDAMSSSESKSVTHNGQEWKSAVITASGNEDSDELCNFDDEDDFEFIPSGYTNSTPCTKSSPKVKPTSSFIKETVSKRQNHMVENEYSNHAPWAQTDQSKFHDIRDNNYKNNAQDHIEFNSMDKENENYLDGKNVEILINSRVKIRLEKLIQNHPGGVWCADLPEKYLEEYRVPLNYTELGFNSVREFASHLPDIFHCVQLQDAGDFLLFDAKREVPSNRVKEKGKVLNLAELHQISASENEVEPIPAAVSLNTCKELIPDDAMTLGETVGYLSVTSLANEEKPYIEVFVVEVFTPSFFWIQLRKKQKAFKAFMDDLHNFYAAKHEQYVIPPVVLEKGLNCACIYNGMWHRGIIKAVNHDMQVTVMFYDYGTLKTYPPNAVYYLHNKFSYLPAQAIPCGLMNTRPFEGSKWSRSTTHCFALRTSEIPLIATIASVNVEDNSMMVTLTDTLEEEDVHINDWLVEQKLAQHGKMVCTKARNFLYRYYVECREHSKQRPETSKVSETNISVKCTKAILLKRYPKNEIALYNSNTGVQTSSEDSFHSSDVNLTLCQRTKKNLELLKFRNSLKSDSSVQGMSSQMMSSEECQLKRSKSSLHEKFLRLKQKSPPNENNNNIIEAMTDDIGTNKSSNINLVTDKKIKQKLENDKSTRSSNEKGIREMSDEKYDILKKYNHIPKAYANHFEIRDSEDEWGEVGRLESGIDKTNGQREIRHMDWSIVHDNVAQRKEYVPQLNVNKISYKLVPKERDNVPLAEDCFLKAVRNSTQFVSRDEEIRWSPTGNITEAQDASALILRNLKILSATRTENVKVAISQETLKTLTVQDLSMESLESITDTPQNTHESPSTSSLLEPITTTDLKDTDIVDSRNSQSRSDNSTSQFENYYVFMKPLTPKYKLLQTLLEMQDTSRSSSDLDSDDISVSEKSETCQETINRADESETNNCENDVNIEETNRFDSELSSNECSVSFVEAKKMDVTELSKCTINKNVSYEELELIEKPMSPERIASANNSTSVEDALSIGQPVLKQQSSLTELSNSIDEELFPTSEASLLKKSVLEVEIEQSMNETDETDQSLSIEETVPTELVAFKESPSSEVANETSNIPVFNDVGAESDEEEWDVQISYNEIFNFLKINSPFNESIENRLAPEIDSGLKIVELNDLDNEVFIGNDYNSVENDVEVMNSSDRIANDVECPRFETENIDEHEKSSDLQTPMKPEESFEVNSKDSSAAISRVPWSVKGKAKTLVGMLAKAKLLQNNEIE